jgi:hypothetical protein
VDPRQDVDLFVAWAQEFQARFQSRHDDGECPGDTYYEDIEDFALAKAREDGFTPLGVSRPVFAERAVS